MSTNDPILPVTVEPEPEKVVELPKESIVVRASFTGDQEQVKFEIFSNLTEKEGNLGLALLIHGMVIAARESTDQMIDIGAKHIQETAAEAPKVLMN